MPDLGITTNSLQQTSQFDLDSLSPHCHHFLEDFKYAELSWSRGHSKVNQVGIATRFSQKWEVVNWAESLLHLQNVVRLWSRQKPMLQKSKRMVVEKASKDTLDKVGLQEQVHDGGVEVGTIPQFIPFALPRLDCTLICNFK